MKLPFEIDLKDKVVVITGAGGVLCSMFAKAMAKTGAKVALLDLNEEMAKQYADEITKDGDTAKGYKCNVLDKELGANTLTAGKAIEGGCDCCCICAVFKAGYCD